MYIYNTHAHTHTHTQVKREDTQCLPVFFYLFFLQVKREDTQPVFSFKLRGAYNMIANLPQAQV